MTPEEWQKGKIYQLRKVDGVVIGVYVNPMESRLGKKKTRYKKSKQNLS